MVKPKISKSDLVLLVCMAILMVMIVSYQKKTGHSAASKSTQSLNYLPSGKFLKSIALGFDEAFADFLWVRTVGYFGAHVKTDQDYTWLIHMLRLTTVLDPRYESPYEFAGVILPSELNNVDEGIAFLQEGIKNIPRHNPRYWLQHFYLGFCYMIYKNEPLKAARHFEIASAFEQSPDFLPLLVGRLYAHVNRPQMGIEMIQSILSDSGNEMARNEYWRNVLIKRMRELMATQDIEMLEHAVSIYLKLFNQRPSQLSDLVDGLILPFIPTDPSGGVYYLAADGLHVESTRSAGKIKAHARRDNQQIELRLH